MPRDTQPTAPTCHGSGMPFPEKPETATLSDQVIMAKLLMHESCRTQLPRTLRAMERAFREEDENPLKHNGGQLDSYYDVFAFDDAEHGYATVKRDWATFAKQSERLLNTGGPGELRNALQLSGLFKSVTRLDLTTRGAALFHADTVLSRRRKAAILARLQQQGVLFESTM